MWILPLIGFVGIIFGFAFLTLAIASGLYYLSELVEEHTVVAKKLLTRLIYSVILAHILLLLVDRFPLYLSLMSIGSHAIYLQNLRFFPTVNLLDPVFILSCALVLLNHYLWFLHFSSPPSPPYHPYSPQPDLPSFSEIASFFFLLIWLVPFALFVSLSASENTLPSTSAPATPSTPYPPMSPYAETSSVMGSLGAGMGNVSAMLSPRSLSRSGIGSRSGSQIRDGGLGFDAGRGRRKRGAKGLVRVAVDGVRGYFSGGF